MFYDLIENEKGPLFIIKFILEPLTRPVVQENPCVPSPCGPNSQCRVLGDTPACSCLPNYLGRPPNCRPECIISAECPGNKACQNEKCIDPCPGSCGAFTTCSVVNHAPMCYCQSGYTGDPFSGCSIVQQSKNYCFLNCEKFTFQNFHLFYDF